MIRPSTEKNTLFPSVLTNVKKLYEVALVVSVTIAVSSDNMYLNLDIEGLVVEIEKR